MSMDMILLGVFAVFGLFMVFTSMKSIIKVAKSKSYEGQAEGEIVDVIMDHSVSKGRRHYYYVPVYEFYANGEVIQQKADFNSADKDKYKTGDKVVIKYDTNNPKEFMPEGSAGGVLLQNALILVVSAAAVVFVVLELIKRFS